MRAFFGMLISSLSSFYSLLFAHLAIIQYEQIKPGFQGMGGERHHEGERLVKALDRPDSRAYYLRYSLGITSTFHFLKSATTSFFRLLCLYASTVTATGKSTG
jgi:hypothetical protein